MHLGSLLLKGHRENLSTRFTVSLSGTKLGMNATKRTARCSEEWTAHWERQLRTWPFATQAGGRERSPGQLKSASKRNGSLGGSGSPAVREATVSGGAGVGAGAVLLSAEDWRERD